MPARPAPPPPPVQPSTPDTPPGSDWMVLHCRPRCEKKAYDECLRNHIPAYLPQLIRKHVYGQRVRYYSVPLFPGYLFCAANPDQKRFLSRNDQIANVLTDTRPERLREQIVQLGTALHAGADVEVLPYIVEGKSVRILGGILKGTEGVVQTIQGKNRVILNIELIGQSVAVEIEGAMLAPLP